MREVADVLRKLGSDAGVWIERGADVDRAMCVDRASLIPRHPDETIEGGERKVQEPEHHSFQQERNHVGYTQPALMPEDDVFDPTEQTHQEETREDRRCNDDDKNYFIMDTEKTEDLAA